VSVATGSSHTAAVTSTGEVWVWGSNTLGQLGELPKVPLTAAQRDEGALSEKGVQGHRLGEAVTTIPPVGGGELEPTRTGVDPPRAAAVDPRYLYKIQEDDEASSGKFKKSTNNLNRQYALRPFRFEPLFRSKTIARQVVCGTMHTAVLSDAGNVFEWGGGNFHAYDPPMSARAYQEASRSPVRLVAGELEGRAVVSIAAGPWWTAAIGLPFDDSRDASRLFHPPSLLAPETLAGFVFTWGVGRNGQLGQGPDQVLTEPGFVRLPPTGIRCELATKIDCGQFQVPPFINPLLLFAFLSCPPPQMQPHRRSHHQYNITTPLLALPHGRSALQARPCCLSTPLACSLPADSPPPPHSTHRR
jgi:hypothetical protein